MDNLQKGCCLQTSHDVESSNILSTHIWQLKALFPRHLPLRDSYNKSSIANCQTKFIAIFENFCSVSKFSFICPKISRGTYNDVLRNTYCKTLDGRRLYYSRTSNNGHCRGIQILSVIGGVR
jgi:hypothetical protein